ncbi:geranylgeranylglycerol-phosphate geranylgeranyltransferase [Hymenobacter cellulosivorans]|uniref:Geranylgeranylglycerol-phosphate geranylgeranyltransferase n=1 Tax=Hymenobacter cellulosivorans TaxID=2932249 RepID=A0ABY4FE33_9BACT|nr:geranylgeranylglycerol-phosphate geranylgeranyltransferase [Hymenobacter cellulosivorans]UOQ54665.1 geranylgeranylglycerol-phosphate geranylgeranyltransferase [Hymenobacter cellulosivorans]
MARSTPRPVAAAGNGGGWPPLLRLIRFPNLLIMALCLALVQTCLLRPADPLAALLSVRFILLAVAALSVAAAGYIINDYYDVKIDVINRPDRLVVGRVVNRRHAMLAHLLLSGLGVGLAGLLSPVLGAVNMGSALLLWGYSARFKRLALVGNLSIALLTAALVLLPELQLRTGQTTVWVYALAAFLLTVVREIVKDVEDMRGDAEHDCRTLPIVWGVARTKWAVGFFLLNLVILVVGGVLHSLREQHWLLGGWLLLTVLIPAFGLGRYLARADRRRDFAQLSAWCKWIMLAGVLSMVLVRLY